MRIETLREKRDNMRTLLLHSVRSCDCHVIAVQSVCVWRKEGERGGEVV